jgi:hypothetical protein
MGLERRLWQLNSVRAFGRNRLLFLFTAFVLGAVLFLGGAHRGGFLSDVILQLLALPLLLLVVWRLCETPLRTEYRLVLAFCMALLALPLLQLVPLPPWLWSLLPSRGSSAALFDLIGNGTPWLPISVAPQLTWVSAISLIVPLAIFLATLLLTYRERRWLSVGILAIGTVGVFVGLIQVSQGPQSPWRFFTNTSPTEAVGFFANRNHFAALGYTLFLLAAAWVTNAAVLAGRALNVKQYDPITILAALGGFTLLVVLLAGEAMARSRAGLALTIVALLGAFTLSVSDRRVGGTGFTSSKVLVGAILLGFVLSVQYALYRILERFEQDPFDDTRWAVIPTALKAGLAYLPTGSGVGTFVPVYATVERTENALLDTYASRAYSDAAELWLENGVFGVLLLGLFLLWFARQSVAIWRSSPPPGASEVDWSLARAATIIVALILVHSLVEYPLRTAAMMSIMAFCCALLIPPLAAPEEIAAPQIAKSKERRLQVRPPTPAPVYALPPALVGSAASPQAQTGGERWGSDIEWPEEWRKGPTSPGSSRGER